MSTKIFAISNGVVTLQSGSNSVALPLTRLLAHDPGGIFLTGVNEYWRSVNGIVEVHQIGLVFLPAASSLAETTPNQLVQGNGPSTPQWINLLDFDPLVSNGISFIPSSRAPYCDRIEEFKALVETNESLDLALLPNKRVRLFSAMQGNALFRRSYEAAKISGGVNAALTMVVQFITGAVETPDEITFRYFADLISELSLLGPSYALSPSELEVVIEMFEEVGYDSTLLRGLFNLN